MKIAGFGKNGKGKAPDQAEEHQRQEESIQESLDEAKKFIVKHYKPPLKDQFSGDLITSATLKKAIQANANENLTEFQVCALMESLGFNYILVGTEKNWRLG